VSGLADGHVAGTTPWLAASGWLGRVIGLLHQGCWAKTLPVSPGAIQLSAQQRRSLERDGYLLVPSLLGDTVIARMAGRLAELVHQTVAAWAADPALDIVEPGVVHAKLGLADPDFAPCCDHPLLGEAATAVLGPDWHRGALSLRAPLPGCGHQGLHPDFEQRRTEGPWQTLSAMWCITAFTSENGPLRVIPGSHRVSEPPIDMLAFGSGMGPHPDEVKIVAPAGSVIMFNSADLWHSGTFNYSPSPRLAITVGFSPGHSPPD
jgi:phytanoyl-CoA dioxygenase PhyH